MLAAGQSRRFGSDKRVALLPDGHTLLATSLQRALCAFAQVALVLRADDDAAELGVPEQVKVVRNANSQQGMASSLVVGIQALQSADIDAVAVLLADMPQIQPATFAALAAMASPEHIVVPVYQGQRGHPVLFGRSFWSELMAVQGDAGARDVVRRYPARVRVLTVQDPGVCIDVDDAAALGCLSQQQV
ncbi:NTP transferase domain-containing protein [Pseudomonas sp. 5Ae-yellow]|uniref:nucleotidyltransferase family protein n=1 Tax=Pseudomonas sp. 5Ae-yellow TaxID=2759848 RepID=UPI0015F39939|nr:nucleotidyltransferase family protein [Pseudomonas sp. 5Ae-yellow]MBA6418490.1 nucleotidyltransferase family protein [Pseudomonas sp. 5Ae-yellow]|tara:strand:- start:128 stop:694 length:567 start_codon:yes stop_codon:yes gene_type:complete